MGGLTPLQFKQRFIQALFNRGVYTRQVNDVQYVTRCPYCGDTQKNMHTGHFYIRVGLDDNFPIVYNCFKCPEHGVMNRKTLELLEMDDIEMTGAISYVNKKFTPIAGMKQQQENAFKVFPYTVPDIKRHPEKLKYIEDRLGIKMTDDKVKDCRVITSLKDFMIHNQITTLMCPPKIAQLFEDDYVGFLSYGNSHIFFRDTTGKSEISWVKYPINMSSRMNGTAYSLASSVDLFTDETITINLSEGIMDIISIKYNLGYDFDNCINMSIGGKSYIPLINRLIGQGFVGYNVILNIFADNDAEFNKHDEKKGKKTKDNNYDTSIEYYRKVLQDYTILFKEVNVYYNRAYKDCGVTADKICLKRYRI